MAEGDACCYWPSSPDRRQQSADLDTKSVRCDRYRGQVPGEKVPFANMSRSANRSAL